MLTLKSNEYTEKCTASEFIAFIENHDNKIKTFELIGGSIVALAGNATTNHQRITGYIYRKLGNYLEGKQCEVFQDLNVYLFKEDINKCENIFQPDVLVCCDKSKLTDKGCEGTPEFVVEVVSKSTSNNDYITKYYYYMAYGVKEYWIVDRFKNQIVVYVSSDNDSPIVSKYNFNDSVQVSILGDLYISFNEVQNLLD